jgi:cytochrome c556
MQSVRRVVTLLWIGICVSVVTFHVAGAADEAGSPKGIIEARRATLKKMQAAIKAIVQELKSDTPDKARLGAAAQFIDSNAGQLAGWFPRGTGPEAGVETDALADIWTDRPRFESLASRLTTESKAFGATLAGGDVAAIRTQAKALTEVCAGCHKSFRAQ